eukprot:602379-Karenia_brevis.AAC.1
MSKSAVVVTDANAALGISFRQGLSGRTRHIDTQYLWIQDEVMNGRLRAQKVGTKDNPADLLTKGLDAGTISHHLNRIHCRISNSRAEAALEIQQVTSKSTVGNAEARQQGQDHAERGG